MELVFSAGPCQLRSSGTCNCTGSNHTARKSRNTDCSQNPHHSAQRLQLMLARLQAAHLHTAAPVRLLPLLALSAQRRRSACRALPHPSQHSMAACPRSQRRICPGGPSSSCRILSDPSNSAGLGGRVPVVVGSPSAPTSPRSMRLIAAGNFSAPIRTLERPGSRGTPNTPFSTMLRRKSASTSRMRRPCWASVMARLAALVVFPSPGIGLVNTKVLGERSGRANVMFVRSERYASDTGLRGSMPVTSRSLRPGPSALRWGGLLYRRLAIPTCAGAASQVPCICDLFPIDLRPFFTDTRDKAEGRSPPSRLGCPL